MENFATSTDPGISDSKKSSTAVDQSLPKTGESGNPTAFTNNSAPPYYIHKKSDTIKQIVSSIATMEHGTKTNQYHYLTL